MSTENNWICNGNDQPGDKFLTTNLPELKLFPDWIKSHESLYKFSIEQRDLFWQVLASTRLEWIKDFNKVTVGDFNDENFNLKWFVDGKINVSGKLLLLIINFISN